MTLHKPGALALDWYPGRDLASNIAISQQPVDGTTVLGLWLAPGGGQAIRIRAASRAR